AYSPVGGWPLSRTLIVGDFGCGKGMLARTFRQLLCDRADSLGNRERCARLETMNCASLVSDGEGGRIALFGAREYQAMDDKTGLFERATWYGTATTRVEELPSTGRRERDQIQFKRAGVAFLDEFTTLRPDLQAAILNALEEGEVRRA